MTASAARLLSCREMDCTEKIIELFSSDASALHFGEPVSLREHALQTALQAKSDGASDDLVVGALLHDIGYLIGGSDTPHEEEGSRWLSSYFGPHVTEPVRLHVAAKRYLCTVDPEYRRILSPASAVSLDQQGSLLSPEELREFEKNPFHADAMKLRFWDDRAKVPGLTAPGLESYAAALRRVSMHAP